MDGKLLRIVKGSNVKKLFTLAACAIAVSAALPAGNAWAGPAATGTVKIQWNITAVASLTLEGNYTNTGAGGSDNLTPLTVAGGGNCGAGGAGGAGNGSTALTLDFGAITPSASNPTVCVGLNAAEAQVNTNDTSGVTIQEALTTAPAQAGASICGVAIKSNAPVAWAGAGVSSSNYTAAKGTDTTDTTAANWSGSTCAGLQYSAATVNAQAIPAAATTVFNTSDNTTNPAFFGEDYAVIVPANAAKGADSGTVTYSVITN